jgi:hypothetical protein
MIPVPKRSWFRFSLRTLFAIVTAFCFWLGWNVNLVRERQTLLPDILADNQAWERIRLKIQRAGKVDLLVGKVGRVNWGKVEIAFIRRMFGDKACPRIDCHTEADALRMMRLFPEATVIYFEPLIVADGPVPAWIDEEFQRQ